MSPILLAVLAKRGDGRIAAPSFAENCCYPSVRSSTSTAHHRFYGHADNDQLRHPERLNQGRQAGPVIGKWCVVGTQMMPNQILIMLADVPPPCHEDENSATLGENLICRRFCQEG
jgi:hypothetical protein